MGSSSPTKDRTRIPCIGRQTPNHWTIRAVPEVFFSLSVFSAGQSFLSLRWVGITLPCGEQSSHSGGVSCCGAQALGTGSVVCSIWALVAHGMWNLPGPGIKSHPLHWQADSYPLSHQEIPSPSFLKECLTALAHGREAEPLVWFLRKPLKRGQSHFC